ncbi:NTPase KAP family P-loop domain-containing protein 1-like [Acipenser oxyrinchus oxyrinchus]|uniref:NTPase KAP family P-loop domain-containing protein 1-like n=1 Tax=Acipenser oxyrinchus oxyrinchus TaxID=40147 RepID=A0AAD8FRE9_ACIOX|nr:NTPase KAP family P-loop domain-containing protein 1-like [Acipenser oxyrinchus oxyrinchus]
MATKDTEDDIYAYGLSVALTKVAAPSTVGLYSSCPRRIKGLLRKIETNMKKESERREKKYPPAQKKGSLRNFLSILLHMIFYWPKWSDKHKERKNVQYIFIRFNAWHFTGTDKVWAGLVITLCESFQTIFGSFLVSIFRTSQQIDESVRKTIKESCEKEWLAKKICCLPLWLLTIVTAPLVIGLIAVVIIVGFPVGDSSDDGITAFESMAIATLGVPAAGAVRFTFLLSKNLMFSQDFNIQSLMDKPRMSTQLGFMNEVRKEVEVLINFIRFMEVYERRNIRVVLEITNLDRCTPEKIVGVLEAINILLSGENIPFISILAIDPRVIVKSVESSKSFEGMDKNGYLFLNRIVTLPFTVPEMEISSKRSVFRKLVECQSEFPEGDEIEESQEISYKAKRSPVLQESFMESGISYESQIPLISSTPDRRKHNVTIQKRVKDLIKESLRVISDEGTEGTFNDYLMENSIYMRRIINSVRVSIIIMAARKRELPPAKEVAAWIVLANQWPCRLSWILQCIEDDEQRAEIDKGVTGEDSIDETKCLWDVFCESRIELHLIKDQIKNLLEMDGDPELFEMFLKKDFLFTIKKANFFKAFTVNLDQSIKKELEIIRGSKSLKDTIKSEMTTPLKTGLVLKMNEDDVCKEMKKLKFNETNADKYMQRIKENKLDGRALLFGHNNEIKNALQMSMGEWTDFSIHFLGIKPQAVCPARNSSSYPTSVQPSAISVENLVVGESTRA